MATARLSVKLTRPLPEFAVTLAALNLRAVPLVPMSPLAEVSNTLPVVLVITPAPPIAVPLVAPEFKVTDVVPVTLESVTVMPELPVVAKVKVLPALCTAPLATSVAAWLSVRFTSPVPALALTFAAARLRALPPVPILPLADLRKTEPEVLLIRPLPLIAAPLVAPELSETEVTALKESVTVIVEDAPLVARS